MAKEIKNLVGTIFGNQNDWRYKLLQAWPSIVGNLGTRVTIEKMVGDTLVIGVYDSCWLQELYMLSPVLLEQINKSLERPYIKQVRFKKAGIAPAQYQKVMLKKRQFTCKHMLTIPEQDALAKVSDEQLRSALQDFLMRCYQEKQ